MYSFLLCCCVCTLVVFLCYTFSRQVVFASVFVLPIFLFWFLSDAYCEACVGRTACVQKRGSPIQRLPSRSGICVCRYMLADARRMRSRCAEARRPWGFACRPDTGEYAKVNRTHKNIAKPIWRQVGSRKNHMDRSRFAFVRLSPACFPPCNSRRRGGCPMDFFP